MTTSPPTSFPSRRGYLTPFVRQTPPSVGGVAAPTLLTVIDGWIRDPAIRRAALVALFASLAALVAIFTVVGPGGLALLAASGLVCGVRSARKSHRDEPTGGHSGEDERV